VDRAVAAVAGTLERLGHHVEESCPDVRWESLRACMEAVWSVDLAGLAGTFARLSRRDVGPDHVEAASLACIHRGRQVSALELEGAASFVNSTARRWGGFLDEHDLFVCPTAPTTPPPSGVPDQDDQRIDTAGAWLDQVFERSPFTPIANLTGQPSVSLPLGESADGLPIGVMLTAQTLREDLLLQIAAVLEQEMPWVDRHPAIVAAPADLRAR
jgi:amidase